jgi:hypothetical protein
VFHDRSSYEERAIITDPEKKIEILMAGGYVGNPRRKTNL